MPTVEPARHSRGSVLPAETEFWFDTIMARLAVAEKRDGLQRGRVVSQGLAVLGLPCQRLRTASSVKPEIAEATGVHCA